MIHFSLSAWFQNHLTDRASTATKYIAIIAGNDRCGLLGTMLRKYLEDKLAASAWLDYQDTMRRSLIEFLQVPIRGQRFLRKSLNMLTPPEDTAG